MRLKFWGNGYTLASDKLVRFTSFTYAAGRSVNIFSINELTAEDGGEPTAAPPGITVASYNVYQEESREDSGKTYMYLSNADVRTALGTAIAGTAADIIGFNELDPTFQTGGTYSLKTLAEAQGFVGYTWELDHPDDIKDEGTWLSHSYRTYNKYASGFAYKTALFDIADHNYVWLSHSANNTYYDSNKRIRKKHRQKSKKNKPRRRTQTRSYDAFSVANFIYDLSTNNINNKLGKKKHSRNKRNFSKRDLVIFVEHQKQKRCKICSNCLSYKSKIAGKQCFVIFL